MSVTQDLYGSSRTLPTTGEKNWGAAGTGVLQDLCKGADGISCLLTNVGILKFLATSTTLAAGATLTQTHPIHIVAGNGGPVILSTVTPITAPTNNQLLIIISSSDTNTVTIEDQGTAAGLNGQIVLGSGDLVALVYSSDFAGWMELFRSN